MARTRDTVTPDLFQLPPTPSVTEGSLNFCIELRALLSRILKDCPYNRYQVAARMSELLAAEVTKYQLDAWTAESREPWRFPFEYVAAFETACETYLLTEWLAAKRGGQVLFGRETLTAELGRLQRQNDETQRQIRALRKAMGEQG